MPFRLYPLTQTKYIFFLVAKLQFLLTTSSTSIFYLKLAEYFKKQKTKCVCSSANTTYFF